VALRGLHCRRVVLTSSVAAVTDPFQPKGRTYSEDDWHHQLSLKNAYPMAKTLAEKCAWKAYEEQKAKGGWAYELVSINPALVLGEVLHDSQTKTSVQVLFFCTVLLYFSSVLFPCHPGTGLVLHSWVHSLASCLQRSESSSCSTFNSSMLSHTTRTSTIHWPSAGPPLKEGQYEVRTQYTLCTIRSDCLLVLFFTPDLRPLAACRSSFR